MSKTTKSFLFLFILSSLIVCTVPALASTVELTSSTDSTLRRGYNNLNEGANKHLFVMNLGPKRAIVSFDISGLDLAAQVLGADLVLTVADDAVKWENGRPVDLHRVLVPFTEGNGRKFEEPPSIKDRGTGPGVTWSCSEDTAIENQATDCALDWEGGWVHAVETPSATIVHTNDLAPGDTLRWDVTFDIQAAMTEGADNVLWIVRKREEKKIGKVEYYSKDGASEAGDMSLAPRLILTLSDVPDNDGDGYTVTAGDCDDTDAAVNPGAVEVCDGIDNNCDSQVDEGVTTIFYLDADSDGFGVGTATIQACVQPVGYASQPGDCDDLDGAINPGASEICNGIDDDCDTLNDEDFDQDADGFTVCGGDCDDSDASANPGADEICTDGADNNCDGQVDEGCLHTYYADADGDGYGDITVTIDSLETTPPAGYVDNTSDCDDTDLAINPDETEMCGDGLDNNCDGQTDPPECYIQYCYDADQDGYGDPMNPGPLQLASETPPDPNLYSDNCSDCSDISPLVNPGADEICDFLDNDCNDLIDEGLATTTHYLDQDQDGYGVDTDTTQVCTSPPGYSMMGGDCDDDEPTINPGEAEICDGLDNDCDSLIDDGVTTTFYQDADSDGYGLLASTVEACALPVGYSGNPDDCDDTVSTINPDTVWYEDADGDGYTTGATLTQCVQPTGYVLTAPEGDCDDTVAGINPGAPEVCDGIDNNCDAMIDEGVTTTFYQDADGDGYGLLASTVEACTLPAGYSVNSDDCDDTDSAINPTTVWYEDADGDGYTTGMALTQCVQPTGYVLTATMGDCDDTNAGTSPGASETCNAVDDNCDGQVDEGVTLVFYPDADGDGYGLSSGSVQACSAPTGYAASPGDCDDLSFDVNPGASEVCDGLDNDCDGTTDPGCLTGITVDPESFSLTGTTSTQQLTVTGYYSDGTSLGLTGSSTGTGYSSSDTAVADVTPEGLVTAVGTGSAVITASNGGFDTQAVVTVQMLPETYIPQPEGSFGSVYEDLVPPDVAIESYDERRFAVITGLVEDRFGGAIAGVTVTVHDYPEYGSVLTDQTGRFSIPVNGAATLTIQYEKTGLLTLHRQVEVSWNGIAVAPTVTMLQRDSAEPTLVMFTGDPADVSVHQSSDTVDSRGSRAASLVFGGDNRAYTYDEQGSPSYHSTISVSATEYDTPESMPAVLPPTSAFTYCVELEADGYTDLHFEKPVMLYVDNFIGFDVGMAAPLGFYNMKTAQWEAMDNGVVVRLLDLDLDGIVDALDATGDDIEDDLNGDGSYADEVAGLDDPTQYSPGDTYMRVEIDHFSSWDVNFPRKMYYAVDPILDLAAYLLDSPCKAGPCNTNKNSYIEQRSRVYNEDIPVPGTGMTLHYASDRVEDAQKQTIVVPASSDTIPEFLLREVIRVEIAGQVFESIFDATPNQKAVFEWDGLDYRGRPIKESRNAKVKVGWVFESLYQSPAGIRRSFALPGSEPTGIYKAGEEIRWREWDLEINPDPGGGLARGWTLSPRHRMNLASTDVLYKGDGSKLEYPTVVMDIFVGNPSDRGYGFLGEGGLAVDAMTYAPRHITVDKDRNVYFVDVSFAPPNIWKPIILKVDNRGIVTRYAGKVLGSSSGEGGPALDWIFSSTYSMSLAAGPNGDLFVADGTAGGAIVNRIDANGIITRYAGGGSPPDGLGNNGPATDAAIAGIDGIAADRFGNLYIVDRSTTPRRNIIRKVSPDGLITTIAGQADYGFAGDGGLAINAKLNYPRDVAVDKDGNVYVADYGNNRVRKITPAGIITTIAGNGQDPDLEVGELHPAEGGPATAMPVEPVQVDVDDYGNVYFTNSTQFLPPHQRLMKVDPAGIITTVAGGGFGTPYGGPASEALFGDGMYLAVDELGNNYLSWSKHHSIRKIAPATEYGYSTETGEYSFPEESMVGHVISQFGLHERTEDLSTGQALLTFGYDSDRNPVSITDRFGNETTVQRDVDGEPVSITSPDGITTSLIVDGNGDLTRVTYPDGTFYSMVYSPGGLMTFETDPAGNQFETRYDSNGRVSDVLDPEGGHWTFDRAVQENGFSLITIQSTEGDLTSYADVISADGEFTSLMTGPDGSASTYRLAASSLSGDKQTSCGMDINFNYTLDREYKFKVMNSSTTTMPSALSVTTSSKRTYSDTNADGTKDLITDTLTVNGKISTVVNNVLTGTVTATSPTGRQVTSNYSPATLLTSRTSTPGLLDTDFTYDTRGRLDTVSVGTRTTTFAYDGYGYLDYMTTPDGRTFDYTYDIMGRLTGEDRPDGGQVDYSYDNNGNVTAIVNPNTITHDFTYTANDQRESYNTPVSGSYVYEYDRDRRLKNVMYPSGATITNIWATGQLQSTDTPEGLITYGYDCGGKLGSVSKGGESSSYTYDGSLLLTDTRAGSISGVIEYGYNADLQVGNITYAGQTDSFLYDNDGLLTDAGAYSISRDAANGLPESITDGTVTQGRNFSSYGEVDGVDYNVGAYSVYAWSVVRDNAGRITQKVENIGLDTVTWDYTYDQMGRLETVFKDSIMAEAYSYDGQGNRVEETNVLRGMSRTYTHDDEDKIVWAGLDFYQYDVDGFLTSRSIASGANSGITTFDYSSRGELLSVSLPASAGTITYTHDPMGRRISKSVNNVVVEKYLWQDATTLLAVYDGSNNLLQRFEYADGRMPVAMTSGAAVYYLAYDQVGSLRVVTDAAGTIVKRIDYDSFGNILSDSNPAFTVPFGFAGGLHDRDTGLVRFGARDYDPATGKWTAKDPIDFGGGDLNLGSYVGQDPVNWVDPEGLSKDEEITKGAYKFVKYAGDTMHGGEHWHVYQRKGGQLLGRMSTSGKVLTGSIPKRAIKILTKLGKIGGLAIGILLELADPAIAGGPESVIYQETPLAPSEPEMPNEGEGILLDIEGVDSKLPCTDNN